MEIKPHADIKYPLRSPLPAVEITFANPTEAEEFAHRGMPGHPFKSVKLRGQALVAIPSEVAKKPLRTVLPEASLTRSQQSLADEAARLGALIVSEPEADRPIDATPENIAILDSLRAGIGKHLGNITIDNA